MEAPSRTVKLTFQCGTDGGLAEELEKLKVAVGLGSGSSAVNYLVFKERNGATTYQGTLSGGSHLAVCEPNADSLCTQSIATAAIRKT
jgi:hypothetical protein